MIAAVQLAQGESLLNDGSELCYRQITKHTLGPDGTPAINAFGPASIDKGMPSYARASVVTPQESRDWHTYNANTPSEAVFAVSVSEVTLAQTYVVDDSALPEDPAHPRSPGHCYVDFRSFKKPHERTVRAVLLREALKRGEIKTEKSPPKPEPEDGDILPGTTPSN
ncbi:hypothetical protein [Pseudoclavibacter sp. Z016]|uniref:hypothetical protein n=1 Tax=Pseudoclavibacter sp. Z016 TaxID=2080581 RepID=UPI000CE8C047|nr:hypothetical protein [Pseudoclavibacter sp. Z016]PPF77732.1 hypothetical protein C5B99_02750 [Pseudoclavibacter sp. Z016]